MTVTQMTYDDWRAALEVSKPRAGKPVPSPNGMSPGGVAAELGICRQAVHNAIKSGTMDAVAVPVIGGGRYWFIPDESIEAYKRDHLRFEPPKK